MALRIVTQRERHLHSRPHSAARIVVVAELLAIPIAGQAHNVVLNVAVCSRLGDKETAFLMIRASLAGRLE